MATKKIIVTGGCGYVGSRVARILAERGEHVIVVDIATPEERGIQFSPNIEYRQCDLRIPEDALKGLEGGDMVLHLAADIGSLQYMHEKQADILTNNARIDAAVYPALRAHGISWIIYSSSSGVFQHAQKFPYTEKDLKDVRMPSNVYFFSKLMGEYFCRAFSAQYDIPYTIVRYHNIYGPGEDSKGATPGDIHVIPALVEKVLNGQYPLEFLGDPRATRSFTYVDDAVEATILIIDRVLANDAVVRNEDFNIGNDTFHSILELGKIIWERYGDGRVFDSVVVDTKADTSFRREVDISKIRSVLGWSPETSLESGLEPTVRWIRERGSGRRSLWG